MRGKHPLLQGTTRSLTVKEVAVVLDCSSTTIYRMCDEGKVSHNKPRGRIRIPLAEAIRLEREWFPELYMEEAGA
ncbi:MAG: helix-turn-helix domain-containing protein [Bacillota bacterium]